jgi:hypothetical protein
MELSLVKSSDNIKKEQQTYQEIAKLKNEAEELKMAILGKETDISALMTRNRALET